MRVASLFSQLSIITILTLHTGEFFEFMHIADTRASKKQSIYYEHIVGLFVDCTTLA